MDPVEEIARRQLGALLEVDVLVQDRNQGTSIVDLVAVTGGKTIAIIEVTSLVHGSQRALEAQLEELSRPAPLLDRSWSFWLGPRFPYRKLSHVVLERVALDLQRAGVLTDHDLDWGRLRAAVPKWLLDLVDAGQVEFAALNPSENPQLHVIPRLSRGGGLPGPEVLVPWWRREFLDEPKDSLAKRLEKLRSSDVSEGCERQLWVAVDMDFVNIGVANALCFEDRVPDQPVDMPTAVDRVWLYSGWTRGGIVQVSSNGWSRHPLVGFSRP